MTDASPDKRWRGRLAVPQHACPLVRQMFEIMNAERLRIMRRQEARNQIADGIGKV